MIESLENTRDIGVKKRICAHRATRSNAIDCIPHTEFVVDHGVEQIYTQEEEGSFSIHDRFVRNRELYR